MPFTVVTPLASETGRVLRGEFEGSLPALPQGKQRTERRGVLKFGSLFPCWDLVAVPDVIEC